jgi:hypothetical protein
MHAVGRRARGAFWRPSAGARVGDVDLLLGTETFIAHCDVAARDLLYPYGDVVIALSVVLRIARTLDGAEIDKLISDVEARKAVAVEHRSPR